MFGTSNHHVNHWTQYANPPWKKQDRDSVTVLLSVVEPRKSYFVSAFLDRMGIKHVDLGGCTFEDATVGKMYGTPNLCNPVYFVAGRIIRTLDSIREESGMSRAEICDKYVFVCPSGPCSPCRYGMYTQEYFKAINDAGYEGFRIITFSSDVFDMDSEKDDALQFTFSFRINLLIALILADVVHARDMETRPYEKQSGSTQHVVRKAEKMIYEAFRSPFYLFHLPRTLRKVGRMFDEIETVDRKLPKIFITGEIFGNNAHGDPSYNLREFCMEQGCEVNPALFTQRVYFDFYRRMDHTEHAIKYDDMDARERSRLSVFLFRQKIGLGITEYLVKKYFGCIGARTHYPDIKELFSLAHPYYHQRVFGGEGNLEVAEAIEQSNICDGFISIKPFGCMSSSGVSDGVQAKVQELHPGLNFLSIETSGDNATNVLNRVSMLLFKAKKQHRSRLGAAS
jgi:predicted nucleotide-binding protein (sugar kinase/HSP70/actin superfamily)